MTMIKRAAGNSESRYAELKRYAWALVAAWTILVGILMVWDALQVRQVAQEMALNEARAHFQRDQAFRLWSATHGGFYVPIDDRTPPSPYLAHVPERDIETPSGKQLTLMNPAYAIRQMNEDFNELYGVAGHITSLKPLRPENAADDWEREALEAFEDGETEVSEFAEIGGEPHLRLMQPMLTAEGCLKCHAHQGYQVGDVRGGVSVAVPLDSYLTNERETIVTHTLSLGAVWAMGLVGIGLGTRGLGQRIQERDQAQRALQRAHDSLDEQVRERTTELRESEEKYRALYDNAPLSYQSLDEDGCFLDVNPAWLSTLGYAREEVIGKSFAEFLHPDWKRHFEKILPEFRRRGHVRDVQFKMRHNDGHHLDIAFEGSTGYTPDGSSRQTYCVFQDITEQVRAEEALRIYSERLEEMVAERTGELEDAQEKLLRQERLAALGELAGSVSHELRNPLGAISNAHYLLKMTLAGSDEMTQETLDIIGDAVDQSEKIISDLLDFARVRARDQQIIAAETLVRRAIAASTIPEGVAVQVEMPAGLPPLFVDPQQMEQVLVNLVTNAYQAMDEGGKLTVTARVTQDGLDISVADTGTGIPAANMGKLFEPLFTTKAHGIGLGLAVSKKLAEANGGSVDVKSVEGEGSTFSLRLPVTVDPVDG